MVRFHIILIIYLIICVIDSLILRNIKKRVLYRKAFEYAKTNNKVLVVLGSPSLDLSTGGVVSYVTVKIIGSVYGCGDICVDLEGCGTCENSYTGDILEFLSKQDDDSCVLFSTGVLEFTKNYEEIEKQIQRTCVENFTEYYSPWNITWYSYGCNSSKCGLLQALPGRVFWTNPLSNLFF